MHVTAVSSSAAAMNTIFLVAPDCSEVAKIAWKSVLLHGIVDFFGTIALSGVCLFLGRVVFELLWIRMRASCICFL